MQLQTLLPLTTLLSLALASPAPLPTKPAKNDIRVSAFSTSTCSTAADIKNLKFTKNDQCKSFENAEAGFSATSTSKKDIPEGCVLQVFADEGCADVLAAITIGAGCEAPLLGPAMSAKLAGC